MVTHPDGFENTVALVRLLSGGAELPVTALIAPTAIRDLERLSRLRQAGADRLGIGLDAATPELFERWRGRGQGGPHRWEHYRATVGVAVGLFGRGNVGVHLIVGLGESERQMAATIQKLHDQGAITHLFSFFPEAGTPLGEWAQPPIGQYRRVQLARYIVNERLGRYEDMIFDDSGRIVGYGQDTEAIVRYGEPFRTSGCPGVDGLVACNRPFGNERARDPLRNYPIPLDPEDIELARYQLRDYAAGEAAEQLPPGAAGVPCPPSPDALSGEGS
jgi:biotin synthase